jgi:hypothetical protein
MEVGDDLDIEVDLAAHSWGLRYANLSWATEGLA